VRVLFEKHGLPPGLPEDGVEKAAIELIGDPSLHAWFERAVRSTQELQLDEALGGAGLKAVLRPAAGSDDKGGAEEDPDEVPEPPPQARSWLGAVLREKPAGLEVASVAEGSPAQKSGLAAGDELIAADGFRSELKQRLQRAQPGQSVRLSLFRMDELLEVSVPLAAAPRDTVTFVPDEQASPGQLLLRESWLGANWPAESA